MAELRAKLPQHDFLYFGDNARALSLSAALEQAGYLVTAIRPPTVPEQQARLRITLSCEHNERDVDGLLAALAEALGARKAPLPA